MWIAFLISGIIAWTFTEYMLHRFLGHVHKGKNFFKAEHLIHHSKANYFAPAYNKDNSSGHRFGIDVLIS